MATYSAGNDTKRKIEEVARTLFYQHGFSNTTYAQVSKLADVNLGTIVYHFKSLDHLADKIYKDIVVERKEIYDKKYDSYFGPNDNYKAAKALAQYRVNAQTYRDYPNYSKFIAERMLKSDTWNAPFFDYSLYDICREFKLNISMNEYILQKYLFLPYAAIAINAVNNGDIHLTVKEVCDFQFKVRLKSYGMEQEDIDMVLAQVDNICDKVKININEKMNFF